MKRCLRILALVTLMILFSVPAKATGELDAAENVLTGDAGEMVIKAGDTYDAEGTLRSVLNAFTKTLSALLPKAAAQCAGVCAVCLLCSVLDSSREENTQTVHAVRIGGTASIAALTAGGMCSLLTEAAETVKTLGTFSATVLPVMTSAMAATGCVTSAGAMCAVTAFGMEVLVSLTEKLVLPAAMGFTALSVAGAALGNETLDGAARLLKTAAGGILTAVTLSFTLYLTVTGAVTGAADAAAVKTAKTAISLLIPVVGGMISDASAAVVSAGTALRTASGLLGLLGTAAICVIPAARLGLWSLMYRITGSLCQTVAPRPLGKLIKDISDACVLMLGAAGACGIMLFLAMTAMIRVGTGG